MNRRWSFQKFITEGVDKKSEDEGESKGDLEKNAAKSFLNGINNVPVDMEEIQSFLKKNLTLSGAQVMPSTIGSSSSLSEEDKLILEKETMENKDPADANRVRRKRSHRVSVRYTTRSKQSIRRTQIAFCKLQLEVYRLRFDIANLSQQIADKTQEYETAVIIERALQAACDELGFQLNNM